MHGRPLGSKGGGDRRVSGSESPAGVRDVHGRPVSAASNSSQGAGRQPYRQAKQHRKPAETPQGPASSAAVGGSQGQSARSGDKSQRRPSQQQSSPFVAPTPKDRDPGSDPYRLVDGRKIFQDELDVSGYLAGCSSLQAFDDVMYNPAAFLW